MGSSAVGGSCARGKTWPWPVRRLHERQVPRDPGPVRDDIDFFRLSLLARDGAIPGGLGAVLVMS